MKLSEVKARITSGVRDRLAREVRALTEPVSQKVEEISRSHPEADKVQLMVDTSIALASETTAEVSKLGAAMALGMAIAIGLLGGTVPYTMLTPIAMALGSLSAVLGTKYLSEKLSQHKPELKRKISSALKKLSDGFVKLFKSMPKFIYPSVHHATPEQVKLVYDTLDKLPIHYVTATHTINFDPKLADGLGAAGLNQQLFIDRPVTLDVSQMALSKEWAEYVITHELGHANDFLSSQHLNGFLSSMKPFNKPPYVTEYAKTNQFEDLAESYAHYHLMPEKLKAIAPEKYEALAKVEAVKSVDPLNVIASQKPVRELGRRLGELLSQLPYPVRYFLVGLSTALPLYSLGKGSEELAKAKEKGDEKASLSAKSVIAPALSALVAPPSVTLATVVEGIALKKLVDKGKISLKRAHQVLNATIATLLGPIGGALLGVLDGLTSRSKASEGSKVREDKAGAKSVKPNRKDWLKFIAVSAGAVALAVASAVTLGGAIAPALGALVAEKLGFTAGAVAELVGGRLIATGLSYGVARVAGTLGRKVLGGNKGER